MKKIVKYLFIFLLGFIFISKVNASTVKWEDITTDLAEYVEYEYDAEVTKTNNSFKAVIEEFEYDDGISIDNYVLELKYENNIISLVGKDKSKFNKNEKLLNGFLDAEFLLTLLDNISNYYEESEFDAYDALEKNDFSKYGIDFVFSENLSTEDVGPSLDITKFSINLNTFETAVKGNTSSSEEQPEVSEDTPVKDTPVVETPSQTDKVTEDENQNNPGTGDSTVYIIISFLILCIGLIIYKFKSLDNYNTL